MNKLTSPSFEIKEMKIFNKRKNKFISVYFETIFFHNSSVFKPVLFFTWKYKTYQNYPSFPTITDNTAILIAVFAGFFTHFGANSNTHYGIVSHCGGTPNTAPTLGWYNITRLKTRLTSKIFLSPPWHIYWWQGPICTNKIVCSIV